MGPVLAMDLSIASLRATSLRQSLLGQRLASEVQDPYVAQPFIKAPRHPRLMTKAVAVPQPLPSLPAPGGPQQQQLPPFSSSPMGQNQTSERPVDRTSPDYNPYRPSAGVRRKEDGHLAGPGWFAHPDDLARNPVTRQMPTHLEEGVDEVWLRIRMEARQGADAEPFLASYLYSAILAHSSMEGALAFHLANKLADSTLLSTQLKELFQHVLRSDVRIQDAIRADLMAVETRDPACLGYTHGMLNFKGYQAIQTYRIAHKLWVQGRESLALALANRISEVFHVEIHPAARILKGFLLDHATGVVIGETAFIGENVSILHDVTLGGTGCTHGLRHPQVMSGVLIGAGAKLLGPITIGADSKIGAGSVVLESVPPNSTVVGNPGKVMPVKSGPKKSSAAPSETMEQVDFADWVI